MSHVASFAERHIGINAEDAQSMLDALGIKDMEELIAQTVPASIHMENPLDIPAALSEHEYLIELKHIAAKNKVFNNFIGQGYYGTITPSVLLRNIFENPGWYTQYTPYQAEISQGRLEALLNFQTMVSDLTGLPLANASLLDEATSAAEAMTMFFNAVNKKRKKNPASKYFVDQYIYTQTLDVLKTRAQPLGIELIVGDWATAELDDTYFGACVQYPNELGDILDYETFINKCHEHGLLVCMATDLQALTILKSPGALGADAAVGNTQRFGVPMGYGGPHAGFFATKEDFKRLLPGRIIGISVDRLDNYALRMALQTREQHIKREKATSNICTAQALLAVMAGMYAVYHGPKGLKAISKKIHHLTFILANNLQNLGLEVMNEHFFDTISIKVSEDQKTAIRSLAEDQGVNLFYRPGALSISIDETKSMSDVEMLLSIFARALKKNLVITSDNGIQKIPSQLVRTEAFMTHPVFSSHQTETKMMRYLKRLENKDLSLVHSMIPLGSCTMKLNAASELIPVSWEAFSQIHPFAPTTQTEGYQQIFDELEKYLAEITGFTACSLQPNSGAQGEYTGLMTIAAYHKHHGNTDRDIALIPSSAHGTNPASAIMAGMKVVIVACDDDGNIDLENLKQKAEEHKDKLSALMITYPSTHGVFETEIREICKTIHDYGGLVYMDGANMNAQVGVTSPGIIGADVCHLNLHKTFAIPHGGGGPGMGPICVNDKLAPFLPGHSFIETGGQEAISAVSAAPWGSASILLISYAYIKMLGAKGLKDATLYAILNANYIKKKLEAHYDVLYTGENGMVAHELILDLRNFKEISITAEDVAKRLIDYGFHAPTLSFPVPGTIMIEPTESEDLAELDRFCEAMIAIRGELSAIENGGDQNENVLKNAPHTLAQITADTWDYKYSRSDAAFPLPYLKANKFWPSITRINNAYGDRNLICTCPPIEAYEIPVES